MPLSIVAQATGWWPFEWNSWCRISGPQTRSESDPTIPYKIWWQDPDYEHRHGKAKCHFRNLSYRCHYWSSDIARLSYYALSHSESLKFQILHVLSIQKHPLPLFYVPSHVPMLHPWFPHRPSLIIWIAWDDNSLTLPHNTRCIQNPTENLSVPQSCPLLCRCFPTGIWRFWLFSFRFLLVWRHYNCSLKISRA